MDLQVTNYQEDHQIEGRKSSKMGKKSARFY